MAERISSKPDVLAQQCDRAYHAIGGEPAWPAPPAAPIAMTLLTRSQNLTTQLSVINSLESQLRDARQVIKPFIEDAREDMLKVDQATDLLYGEDSAKKIQFGLSPKKPAGGAGSGAGAGAGGGAGGIEQVVIRATADGTHPASIWVDWEAVEGAVYEIQWFTDAPLTHMIGSATVTASELEVQGLVLGQQYWFRVRAVRASNAGPWSDQATRVANI